MVSEWLWPLHFITGTYRALLYVRGNGMDIINLLAAAAGGVLIGFAASALLLLNGRISGISGVFAGAWGGSAEDRGWRRYFVAGLLLGGVLLGLTQPSLLPLDYEVRGGSGWGLLALGGLLVGFGTRMGSGCTSGHGVCGVSRLSPRSIVAP